MGTQKTCIYERFLLSTQNTRKAYLVSTQEVYRASDFFSRVVGAKVTHGWAEVTHGAKNGGSSSEMMGPSITN